MNGAARNAPNSVGHGGADDSVGETFRRGGRRTVALAGINLEVRAGELVCLLGPSGCGKSTLLRIGAGALESDEGTVTVGELPKEALIVIGVTPIMAGGDEALRLHVTVLG